MLMTIDARLPSAIYQGVVDLGAWRPAGPTLRLAPADRSVEYYPSMGTDAFFSLQQATWRNQQALPSRQFRCGFCSRDVGSATGFAIYQLADGSGSLLGGVYICPTCQAPTFFPPFSDEQIPGPRFGGGVANVPEDVNTLFEEARRCTTHRCFTAAVLLCRKILMHVAVAQRAQENQSFVAYVGYLADEGYVPPNGRGWVDHIRRKGNEANHEVRVMTTADAEELVRFTEMLLRFVYEFPSLVPEPPPG